MWGNNRAALLPAKSKTSLRLAATERSPVLDVPYRRHLQFRGNRLELVLRTVRGRIRSASPTSSTIPSRPRACATSPGENVGVVLVLRFPHFSPLCRRECNNLFSRPQYCFLIAANPMTLTLELPPDLEAGLVAHARAEGLSPELFVQHLLRDQVSVPLPDEMTPAQRAQAWLDSVIGLPWTPPLSDEAISRESMYGDRG
jgi:hypothetical protein